MKSLNLIAAVLTVAGSAALFVGTPAKAQDGCVLVVEPLGHGDHVECPTPGPRPRPVPVEPDVYAAIAATPDGGWGSSWNHASARAADAEALAQCRRHTHGDARCRVLGTVADFCMALVDSVPDRMSFIGGPIAAGNFAADNAMLKCSRAGGRACVVKTTVCADGRSHVLGGHTEFSNGNPIFVRDGGGFGRR